MTHDWTFHEAEQVVTTMELVAHYCAQHRLTPHESRTVDALTASLLRAFDDEPDRALMLSLFVALFNSGYEAGLRTADVLTPVA